MTAARIVGDHKAPRPAASAAFHRSTSVQGFFPSGLLGCPRSHQFGGARRLAHMVVIVGHQAAISSTSVGSR